MDCRGGGKKCHLQKFVEGKMYGLNTAPKWLLDDSARKLGQMHSLLKAYPDLPEGIGKQFFLHITPENALASYKLTIEIAKKNGEAQLETDLAYRIELMKRFPKFRFDLEKLTVQNTHGDYMLQQLICGENQINAIIDWTSACKHPIIWEIMRSYIYASPKCQDGKMDIDELMTYIEMYLHYAPLTKEDRMQLGDLFYYQMAVCDYYRQYYDSKADNRSIYLHQAQFSTKLLQWFEENSEKLKRELIQ